MARCTSSDASANSVRFHASCDFARHKAGGAGMRDGIVLGTATAFAIALSAVETFVGEDEPKTGLFVASAVVVLAVGFGLYVLLTKQDESRPGLTLALGLTAFILAPAVFFSGLPVVIGIAAAWAAWGRGGGRAWQTTVGGGLGVLAALFTVVMSLGVD